MKLLIFRTLLIYLCVLFAMRLMGKRQLGELQPEELVSTILISNLASISIESEEVPVTASLIPLFLIAALELLGSALSFRSQKFFNLMSGRPKTVILDGQIDQNALRTLRLTTADLMETLRGKNIFDPRDVSYAVVETNGSLSAALRPEKETATLADLQLKVEHSHATIPFVLDGQVLEENLHWCGKDQDWLERTAQANTLLPEIRPADACPSAAWRTGRRDRYGQVRKIKSFTKGPSLWVRWHTSIRILAGEEMPMCFGFLHRWKENLAARSTLGFGASAFVPGASSFIALPGSASSRTDSTSGLGSLRVALPDRRCQRRPASNWAGALTAVRQVYELLMHIAGLPADGPIETWTTSSPRLIWRNTSSAGRVKAYLLGSGAEIARWKEATPGKETSVVPRES